MSTKLNYSIIPTTLKQSNFSFRTHLFLSFGFVDLSSDDNGVLKFPQ